MAITLKVPTVKRFDLVESEKDGFNTLVKAPDGQPGECYVQFRQASTLDVEKRTGVMSKRTFYGDEFDRTIFQDETNYDFVRRTDVALTLCGTDILLPDESSLSFEKGHVKDRAQFDEWWNALPPVWAEAIHTYCTEVNILWAPKRASR